MIRTYSELMNQESYLDRFKYLTLNGVVTDLTFGPVRHVNQLFYKSQEWIDIRGEVILRDDGCDMGDPDHPIQGKILVHHMNPVLPNQLLHRDISLIDPEYLISVSLTTHNAIHYGDESQLPSETVNRLPGDTILW